MSKLTTVELTFYDEETDKETTQKIPLKRPSSKVRLELSKELDKQPVDKVHELMLEIGLDMADKLDDPNTDKGAIIKQAISDGKITKNDWKNYVMSQDKNNESAEVVAEKNIWAINVIKIIIDIENKQISPFQKNLILTDAESEFWMEYQEYPKLMDAINSFRNRCLL